MILSRSVSVSASNALYRKAIVFLILIFGTVLELGVILRAFLKQSVLTGNYYGTPRPVHIGPDSPPITYQEHRNLLRNFRTRSKSLSNLEKAVEEGDNSEEDSGLSGTRLFGQPISWFSNKIKKHLLLLVISLSESREF